MAPSVSTVPFVFFEGDTRSIPLLITNADGTPTDITGWTFTFTVGDKAIGLTVFSKTLGSGLVLNGLATAGSLYVTMADADTRGKVGTYQYELQGTAPSQQPEPLLLGTFIVRGVLI